MLDTVLGFAKEDMGQEPHSPSELRLVSFFLFEYWLSLMAYT